MPDATARSDRSAMPRSALLPVLTATACVIAAAGAAWWGVWRGEFVFDDHSAIEHDAALLAGDWWNAAFGGPHQPLANRPLSCLSLVVDFALFGKGPLGPHVGNLVLHVVNALLLLATIRRTSTAPNLKGRFDDVRATCLATVVAAAWVVHPLTVEAVAYATQRSTVLASTFVLLALHATVRTHGSKHPVVWRTCTWLALACAMASKEDAVMAPVLVALFERAFLLPTWAALAARWRWLVALASTWAALAACVSLGPSNPTIGWSVPPYVTAWQWLMTQSGVVWHYLVQVPWPAGLRTFYDTGIVRDVTHALLPGSAVLALLVVSVAAWRTRPWLGWLGALFFLWLAPTSTIMPIVTEIVAERRMYLPMLFVLVPAVFGVDALLRRAARDTSPWLARALAIATATALAWTTHVRVGAYVNDAALWADAFAKREPGSRSPQAAGILTNQALAMKRSGRIEECAALLDEAMLCEDLSEATVVQHALSLLPRGRHDEAIAEMRHCVSVGGSPNAWAVLGVCLASSHEAAGAGPGDPRLAEAEGCLRRAMAGGVANAREWLWIGYVSLAGGRVEEAEQAYSLALRTSPNAIEPRIGLVEVLVRTGRGAAAGPLIDEVLAQGPRDVPIRLRFAALLCDGGDFAAAETLLQQALAIEPGNTQATAMLERARARLPRR